MSFFFWHTLYMVPMQFYNNNYRCIEHAYQHGKCLFFDNLVTASQVMLTIDPAKAKSLRLEVKGLKAHHDSLTAQRYKLVSDLLKTMIWQNPIVKIILL